MTRQARNRDNPQDELDARYARFGIHPLTDEDVWALSMAAMVMPDGNPGAEAYLAKVSGTEMFVDRLTVWGRVVAIGISQAGYKAPNGSRRRAYVEGYDESWGRFAVADGLTLALYDFDMDVLGLASQNRQGYIRIRDFVGGALVNAIAEFRVALEWAAGYRRDRVLEGRWEGITGLNYRDSKADERMGHQSGVGKYPMFAPGCHRTPKGDEAYTPDAQSPPETLYHALRPSDWWDAGEAGRMRKAPVTTIYPGHGS